MNWQVHKNVYFTKGYNRTLIFDSLNTDINFIPNEYYDQLVENNFYFQSNSLNADFFDFLKRNEFVFESNDEIRNLFLSPSNNTDIPYQIGIAVVELSLETARYLFKLIDCDQNSCNFGQFNFIFSVYTNIEAINLFTDFISEYEVDVIELTILENFHFLSELFFSIKAINRIFIVNNISSHKVDDQFTVFNNRMFSNTDIKSLKISPNMITYNDSLENHTYYYNKLFIGKNTEIKNSYETNEIFAYLNERGDFNLSEIKKSVNFYEFWHIKKDDILICSDCEFKRLCSDNRLPIPVGNGKWSHEKECEYNPYISKWSNEKGYLTLNECNCRIQNGKILLDTEVLIKINKSLWGI